ncbi:hypothetical protein ACFZB9_22335 [Kitasatospora sp. NPDC008050]|uniref:hypothetical protein n=1 Tax=Kitasatospora sp. NPDC008050 TaxID=3364021 RepID=UPI0036EA83B9
MAQAGMWNMFQELGNTLDREWRLHDYSEDSFPEICVDLLGSGSDLNGFDPLEFAAETVCGPSLPHQIDMCARFGQPPLTLFSTSRFYLGLLYWLSSTTSIHEHGFQGAFRVVSGSSLHSRWHFDGRIEVSRHVIIGDVIRSCSEVLSVGAVRPILPGPDGAHSLFHLEHPSVTLIARTHADPRAQPQYDYHPPSVATNPFFDDPPTQRRLQLMRMLQVDPERFQECVRRWLATSDFMSSLSLLFELCKTAQGTVLLDESIDLVAERYGSLGEPLREVTDVLVQDLQLTALRERVRDPGARLVLALILNGADREGSLKIFSQKYGGNPVEQLAAAIGVLLDEGDGISIADPVPEILRILLEGHKIDLSEILPENRVRYEEISFLLANSALLKRLLAPSRVSVPATVGDAQ